MLKTIGLLCVWLMVTAFASAATLTVDLNGGADYTDIQAAIDAAADGDTVLVKPGEYVITEPINFNRLHDPANSASPPVKNITVRSEDGSEVTTIRMSETPTDPERASVLSFEKGEGPDSKLEGFTLRDGKGSGFLTVGGGMNCIGSSPTITNCSILGNSAYSKGGGLFCSEGSSPNLTNCTISGNTGGQGGGVYCEESSSPTLTHCTISENLAPDHMCMPGWCGGEGGGIYCWYSSPTLTNCTISWNSARFGGGVNCSGLSCPNLTDCTIMGNWVGDGDGGGVSCINSSPTLTKCLISGNKVGEGSGGGVWCNESSATLTNCMITANSSASGGGVSCGYSSPTLTNCTITGNSVWGIGGGVDCTDSSPELTNCKISGNSSGGLSCYGGFLTLTNCTISGNLGQGGIFCNSSSPLLINCTIWRNHSGASISEPYCENNSSPTLINCIVRGRTPKSACGNLSHCITDQDPLFINQGDWNDNGTPDDWTDDKWIEGDYHLQHGSPAIDAGTSEGAPATDIEGRIRPCGAGVDIGAYEFGNCWPTQAFIRGDSNADGATDLSDAVSILGYLFLGATNVPCEQAADANDDGALDVSDGIYVLSFLFTGGPAIEPPVAACGVDPTGHGLTCTDYNACR